MEYLVFPFIITFFVLLIIFCRRSDFRKQVHSLSLKYVENYEEEKPIEPKSTDSWTMPLEYFPSSEEQACLRMLRSTLKWVHRVSDVEQATQQIMREAKGYADYNAYPYLSMLTVISAAVIYEIETHPDRALAQPRRPLSPAQRERVHDLSVRFVVEYFDKKRNPENDFS